MQEPLKPTNEAGRLDALHALAILDTLQEEAFDQLTALASQICGTPMALLSLVDAERQWFKSRIGIGVDELPRATSFCGHGILGEGIFEITDAGADSRFADNPLVTDDPAIRFYAGAPLATEQHHNVGMLCVIDRVPRVLDDDQRAMLSRLAKVAVHLMQVRRQALDQARDTVYLSAVMSQVGVAIVSLDSAGNVVRVNAEASKLLGYTEEATGHLTLMDLFAPSDASRDIGIDGLLLEARDRSPDVEPTFFRRALLTAGRSTIPVRVAVTPIRTGAAAPVGFLLALHDLRAAEASDQQLERALKRQERQRTLEANLLAVQGSFISHPDTLGAFEELLGVILEHSQSEYGFIGEVLRDENGAPFLKTHALTNIAWTDELRAFYDAKAPQGLEFRNLNTLFGAVMTTGEPVIANDPYHDPRRGGLPPGHPRMDAFLGLPIKSGDAVIGMLGLANRPGGYDTELVEEMAAIRVIYANLIVARQNRISRLAAEANLEVERARLRRAIAAGGLGHWEIDPASGRVSGDWQQALGLEDLAGVAGSETFEAIAREALHPDDQEEVLEAIRRVLEGRGPDLEVEARFQDSKGQWRWFRMLGGYRSAGKEGAPEFLSGTVEDIHDKYIIREQSLQLLRNRVLLQEVHHRVKNNLQVVSSLLSMQERRSGSPEVAEQLAISRNRVAAVAQLHELLYQSSELDSVDYGKVVDELPRRVMSAFATEGVKVQLETHVQTLLVSFDQSGSLALILNELVSNALKHAFQNRAEGRIRVACGPGPEEGWGFLEVRDDGVGFDDAARAEAASRGSIGMDLVRRLTSQAGARISRLPSDAGTHWRLEFPRAQ